MSIQIKFDPESIKRVEAQTREAFNKVIASKKLLDEVGQTVVDDIKFQTRRGQSIPTGSRLKPLSKRWKETRAQIAEATDTQETFSPNRSNLTVTGQLLDSLTWRIVGKGLIETLFKGEKRRPYFAKFVEYYKVKTKSKRRINKGPIRGFNGGAGFRYVNTNKSGVRKIESKISNEQLAEYVQKDRPFVGVRDQVVKRIRLIVISYLRRSSRVLNLFD